MTLKVGELKVIVIAFMGDHLLVCREAQEGSEEREIYGKYIIEPVGTGRSVKGGFNELAPALTEFQRQARDDAHTEVERCEHGIPIDARCRRCNVRLRRLVYEELVSV